MDENASEAFLDSNGSRNYKMQAVISEKKLPCKQYYVPEIEISW